MIEAWDRDQVLALAPDAASQKAAQGVSAPGKWSGAGVLDDVVWGECKGSGSKPYRACVDLSEPAYRCSCPSRKFPCKHALGVLLLWSSDGVATAEAHPDWVVEWLAQRREREERQAAKIEAARVRAEEGANQGAVQRDSPDDSGNRASQGDGQGDGKAAGRAADAERRAAQREERVTAGLVELERWLSDQVAHGVADARRSGPSDWEVIAKRLVDAQAPGVAGAMSRLPDMLRVEDWPGRLLGEYALINLLAVAHRRSAELPAGLRDTVRSRIGFPVSKETVLASKPVRDHWDVIGSRDEERDRLLTRRVWLRGRSTGRPALVLSFAPVGQALDASLAVGTVIDADLAFYPGAAPLRALVARRHGTPVPHGNGARSAVASRNATASGDAGDGDPSGDFGTSRESSGEGTAPQNGPENRREGASESRADAFDCAAAHPVSPLDYPAGHLVGPPPGIGVTDLLAQIAEALAGDPWMDSWPAVLSGVVPIQNGAWSLADADPTAHADAAHLVDSAFRADSASHIRSVDARKTAPERDPVSLSDSVGEPGRGDDGDHGRRDALPLSPSVGTPWELLAISGGHPVTVAVEWTPHGLHPLAVWDEEGRVVRL